MIKSFVVDAESQGLRVDVFLKDKLGEFTRSRIAKMFDLNKIKIGSGFVGKSHILNFKDLVIAEIDDQFEVLPQNIKLDIVYEDCDVLVVNKPKGMITHPFDGFYKDTLVNALLYYEKKLSDINGKFRPGIVHRLDKNTSGLILVAKNNEFHEAISEQIKNHTYERKYEAVVNGSVCKNYGIISMYIGRKTNYGEKLVGLKNNDLNLKSRFALTIFRTLERYKKFTHLELKLKTGRTHQIRVHLSSIGHPIIGDILYGSKINFSFYEGQCLHAKKIGFWHSGIRKFLSFDCELPDYFLKTLNKISKIN
ncbi:MAG: RluA family pseudouridine synthase [Candidatus Improbicoccus pseudotrichonymphae]|uniref:Pseudouridine synthase n=1 Tax=Candidatus Improbicoccus pseudotrichonymphae TaxID=3033792 RepID=A0AA48I156_9FIRM|nr:MAG: RluA family pseudouridine synthase [Candidatus Improbicoccus pseudotrichonymphae]